MAKTNKWGEPVEPRNDIVHFLRKVKTDGADGFVLWSVSGCGIDLYAYHNKSKDPAEITCKRCLQSKAFKTAVKNMIEKYKHLNK